MLRRQEPFIVLALGLLFCLIAGASHATTPTDPAKTAADALVAQGCTIKAQNARMILVDCPGQPLTRIMRQGVQR